MKVGIITFHSSHNYGSMLQAYALQQTILKMGHECEIINLRTDVQKNMYKPFFRQQGWVKKAKALRYPKLALDDWRKYQLFEKFLNDRLVLTKKEYHTSEELKQVDWDFDAYISGSDQIWNTICTDFFPAYFLDFVKKGLRIAYAPSMGPNPFQQISKHDYSFIKAQVSRYDAVSVREQDTAILLKQVTGITAQVVFDPTLLIKSQDWFVLAGDKPLIDDDYIFLYTPWYENYRDLYVEAARLAEKEGIKVICTLPDGYRYWHCNNYFKYFITVGPEEFLNLIKFSRYVLCGSFHAVVFSILFNKQFYAYEGMKDSRIAPLLKLVGLERCAENQEEQMQTSYDAEKIKQNLESQIQQSILFLNDVLNG